MSWCLCGMASVRWTATRRGRELRAESRDYTCKMPGSPRVHNTVGSSQAWINYFEVQLLLVIKPLDRAPPVVRDYFRRFLPGGLPSLGKHK
jgi:hypothetical protein